MQLKELDETVCTSIDNAKKELNPLWALLTEPLGQIIAAVGLLPTGVLGGLGLDKLLGNLGLGSVTDALGLVWKQ